MCVEFGEVTVIIGLVINFLAFRLTIVRISWHLNLLFAQLKSQQRKDYDWSDFVLQVFWNPPVKSVVILNVTQVSEL